MGQTATGVISSNPKARREKGQDPGRAVPLFLDSSHNLIKGYGNLK